jgi:excisionase family DNA binding protein
MAIRREENSLQNEVLTVKEVADYLRVSRVTAWRWCQQGTLPAFRIGRHWRIHRDDLLDIRECGKNVASEG